MVNILGNTNTGSGERGPRGPAGPLPPLESDGGLQLKNGKLGLSPLKLLWSGPTDEGIGGVLNYSPEDFRIIWITGTRNRSVIQCMSFIPATMPQLPTWEVSFGIKSLFIKFGGANHTIVGIGTDPKRTWSVNAIYGSE